MGLQWPAVDQFPPLVGADPSLPAPAVVVENGDDGLTIGDPDVGRVATVAVPYKWAA